MFTTLNRSTQAIIFYAIALGLGAACAFVPGLTALYMFTPTAAALIMLLAVTREGYHRPGWTGLGLARLGLRSWSAAILIPMAVVGAGFGILWASGAVATIMPFAEIKWLNTAIYFGALLGINTLTGSLGEEIGWRGYLLPRLVETMGRVRAYLVGGLGWAVWHYPLIFSGQYNTEGDRLITTVLFTITVLAINVVIGELYLRQSSVWVASLFHSSHNVVWGLLTSFSVTSLTLTYFGGESGVIPLALYTAVAAWMVIRLRGREKQAATQTATITSEN